jgi:primosomal protein N' (replication factor Y)
VPGFVVGQAQPPPPNAPYRIKAIETIRAQQPLFDLAYLDFLRWMAEETVTPLSQVLACALPAALLKNAGKGVKKRRAKPSSAPDAREQDATAQDAARVVASLSPAQQQAVATIWEDISSQPWLLFGVTGSGKTEVYLELAARTLAQGLSVLVMVPEIALTSQVAQRFLARFGTQAVALWHSNLSDGEKVETWRQAQQGHLRLVIGARSGLFVPLANLGLIVMDEEHDGSYKQDAPAPRYHARQAAMWLAARDRARLVLGSATPDVATFYQAQQAGRVVTLTQRFSGQSLATVHLVDMKIERSQSQQALLSRALCAALGDTMARQEQAILLINRRGFYTMIKCQGCDYTFHCPACSVALIYHRSKNNVRCHYCGYDAPVPQYCPACASMELIRTGVGSQRVEDALLRAFPEARILRLDGDVLQRRHAHEEVLCAFAGGEADILVGTQMVAKGLDVANVTLVGVIGADATFSLPDFKAAERGFQLLTQVAGRAGRGKKPGQVFIQTVLPRHPVLQFAAQQHYLGFYQAELAQRQATGFPPYGQVIRLLASAEAEWQAQQFMQATVLDWQAERHQQTHFAPEAIEFVGPAPCVIERIQGRYRVQCLVKNHAGEPGRAWLAGLFRATSPPEAIRFLIDVNAETLL